MVKAFFVIIILIVAKVGFAQVALLSNNLSIYGNSLGDSISAEPLKQTFGKYLADYGLKNDNRVTISTICNHACEIRVSKLTKEEFNSTQEILTDALQKEPVKYFGQTHHGLKLLANELHWYDSIRKIDYSLYMNTIKDSSMSLVIDSEWISDSIGNAFVPNYLDEEDVEIIVIDEEE